MVTIAVTLPREATLGEVRKLLADEHVHMALLVDGRTLVTTIERTDLEQTVPDERPAGGIGSLHGRTVRPDAQLSHLMESMRARRRRRLAVTNEHGELLGLLCLKASGLGFCSNADVEDRKRELQGRRAGTGRRALPHVPAP